MSFQLFQVHWSDAQLPNLYPFATPYKNEGLTVFFENDCIRKIVPEATADKVGVCSYDLRQSMGSGVPMRCELTAEMLDTEYDVLSLMRKDTEQDMIWRMGQWHPGSDLLFYRILEKIGKPKPGKLKNPIYQNHFLAKREIYQAYVSEMLVPFMDCMENDEEIKPLVNVDSGYYKLKPPYTEFAHRVMNFLGTNYVTLHTFLCERLFSTWVNDKYKVVYIEDLMKKMCP